MKLTKELIARIDKVRLSANGDMPDFMSSDELAELRRLALLGLERDATIAAAQSAGHKAGRAAATAEYKAEIERLHGVIKGWELKWPQRDTRADRVGRAVLAVLHDFGWDHAVLRASIESGRLAETVEGCVMLSIERAIRADAMEEP